MLLSLATHPLDAGGLMRKAEQLLFFLTLWCIVAVLGMRDSTYAAGIAASDDHPAEAQHWRKPDEVVGSDAADAVNGQCKGVSEEYTIYTPDTCTDSRDGNETCQKLLGPSSWTSCKWPSLQQYDRINKNPNFDWEGNLLGAKNMVVTEESYRDGVVVLTDIDDTLICSGDENGVAGIDVECLGTEARGLYPGIAELFYTLSVGTKVVETRSVAAENVTHPATQSTWGVTPARGFIPFSARPEALKFMLGLRACEGIDLSVREKVCGCEGEDAATACREERSPCACFGANITFAQYGGLVSGLSALAKDYLPMGHQKYLGWRHVRDELTVPAVFFGDNGQGDVFAAQMMLVESKWYCEAKGRSLGCPGSVLAAFIHDVQKPQACASAECREAWAKNNIFVYERAEEALSYATELKMRWPHSGTF